MSTDEFIGYVGNPDFHDGSIISVRHERDAASVKVRGASGQEYVVQFAGVKVVRATRPDGMMIYSMSEMRSQLPLRRFVFANWDEEDDSRLEIHAESFDVVVEAELPNAHSLRNRGPD